MIRACRHNDALVATIGYDYSYHKCPVDNDGFLQTKSLDSGKLILEIPSPLIGRRNLKPFGGYPPGSLMLSTAGWDDFRLQFVRIFKTDFGPDHHLVKHGVLDQVYPLADFTPLEVFLP